MEGLRLQRLLSFQDRLLPWRWFLLEERSRNLARQSWRRRSSSAAWAIPRAPAAHHPWRHRLLLLRHLPACSAPREITQGRWGLRSSDLCHARLAPGFRLLHEWCDEGTRGRPLQHAHRGAAAPVPRELRKEVLEGRRLPRRIDEQVGRIQHGTYMEEATLEVPWRCSSPAYLAVAAALVSAKIKMAPSPCFLLPRTSAKVGDGLGKLSRRRSSNQRPSIPSECVRSSDCQSYSRC
jgi:hypothetical protein